MAAVGKPEGVGRFDAVRVLKRKKKRGNSAGRGDDALTLSDKCRNHDLWEFEARRDETMQKQRRESDLTSYK